MFLIHNEEVTGKKQMTEHFHMYNVKFLKLLMLPWSLNTIGELEDSHASLLYATPFRHSQLETRRFCSPNKTRIFACHCSTNRDKMCCLRFPRNMIACWC
ncbi:unnamed protein product [Eretmochelys imbricata]